MKFGFLIPFHILTVVLVVSLPALAVSPCALCGDGIAGSYYSGPGNLIYCADCYSKHPVCSGCGKLTESAVATGDRKFCPECYIRLKKCSLCGESIVGSYNYYPDLKINVCSECEKVAARCSSCSRPTKKLIPIGEVGLCEQCASRAERCYSCGTALLRDYSFFEGDSTRKFCSRCVSKYPACDDCGGPSGPQGTKLDDGRYLCPTCRGIALFKPGLVTPIKKRVLKFLENNMGMPVEHNIEYSMQGQDFLKVKSKGMHKDLNGLFYRSGDDFYIYVLYGLRKKDLIWVLAHEIAHAWQAENCSENLSSIDREGFAQWAAYHTLLYYGYGQFARNMPGGGSYYAEGLKKMLDMEKKGGAKAIFGYIKGI